MSARVAGGRADRRKRSRTRAAVVELEPVRPLALKERVISQLTRLIEDGDLHPGDQLPSERELSEELQVSRGTVREAVQFLQAVGLVEIRHGAGTFVRLAADPGKLRGEWREWTIRHSERIRDLLEIRRGLEPFAAELAAERVQPEDLEAMEDALAQMEPVVSRPNVTALVQADAAFHHAVCAASGNPALTEFADALGEQLMRERGATWDLPDRPKRSLAEHRAIYEAIRDRDPKLARDSVLQHLTSVERDLERSLLEPNDDKRG
ncbi:MAG TPA: FadR/GntR family transcriptional regulator [Solirubrobacterales bacterium]|nr:FadR/GntR family transcriptional regulator [Solirubrobacterales bacterium]